MHDIVCINIILPAENGQRKKNLFESYSLKGRPLLAALIANSYELFVRISLFQCSVEIFEIVRYLIEHVTLSTIK